MQLTNLLKHKYTISSKVILTVAYFTALFYLVFFAKRRRGQHVRYLHIIPLKDTVRDFLKINYNLNKEVYEFYSNLLGNIALFIPFSIIAIWVFKINNKKKVLLSAFFLSFSIELLQYIFCVGVADVDDVLLNMLGAITGIVAYQLIKQSCNYIFRIKTNQSVR